MPYCLENIEFSSIEKQKQNLQQELLQQIQEQSAYYQENKIDYSYSCTTLSSYTSDESYLVSRDDDYCVPDISKNYYESTVVSSNSIFPVTPLSFKKHKKNLLTIKSPICSIANNELNSLLDLWVNSMPIKQDKEEAKINNNFLLDILMKEPNKILGENNKNLGKIIVTLAEGYQTGATDEEMDKKIEQFAVGVKSNPEYNNILMETAKKSKEKLQNKIKSLFKIDKN